eukprot:365739-Chlamydomonas_euryale.AAC.2
MSVLRPRVSSVGAKRPMRTRAPLRCAADPPTVNLHQGHRHDGYQSCARHGCRSLRTLRSKHTKGKRYEAVGLNVFAGVDDQGGRNQPANQLDTHVGDSNGHEAPGEAAAYLHIASSAPGSSQERDTTCPISETFKPSIQYPASGRGPTI